MNLLFGAHATVFFAASFACLGSIRRAQTINQTEIRRGLTAFLLTSGGWAASNFGYLIGPSPPLQRACYILGLVCGLVAVGAWLYFCAAYTGRAPKHLPLRRLTAGVLVALILLKLTNPLHHLYFTATVTTTPFPHLAIQHEIIHWVALGLAYALAFVGFYMLLEHFHHAGADTRPLAVLVGLTALPVGVNILGVVSPWLLPMTYEPIGVAVFALGVLFVYAEQFQTVHLAGEIDDPVIFLTQDGHIRDYNQKARAVFPELDGAIGDPINQTIPKLANSIDSDTYIVEFTRNGETEYYHVSENPFLAGETETGRSLVLSDVTDQQEREAQLRLYERAIEGASELIAAIDDDYQYLFANQAYREFHGIDANTVTDRTLRDDIGTDAFETAVPYIEQALAGIPVQYQATRSQPNKPTRIFDIRYYPLEDQTGEIRGVVKTMRDLTEQRERESQLKSLDRVLRHNLRNELNCSVGSLDRGATTALSR